MFCLVGLGNPGRKYEQTRHNAGFLTIDRISQELGVQLNRSEFKSVYELSTYAGEKLILVKPQTFMNLSGEAVTAALQFYKIPLDKLIVIYDDLDLEPGSIRVRLNGSAGGHRGLTSIINLLGSNQFPRIRIGIGRPAPGQAVPDYVLERITETDQPLFNESIGRAADAALAFVKSGPNYAMNHFNYTPPKADGNRTQ